jgi:hypothetical protein
MGDLGHKGSVPLLAGRKPATPCPVEAHDDRSGKAAPQVSTAASRPQKVFAISA